MIEGTLQVSFQIDSSALASWMNPSHCHKNVFIRNSCVKINDLCLDASKDYNLQVDFSHVAGVGNISDYNSKTSLEVSPRQLDQVSGAEDGQMDTNAHVNLTFCAGIM